VNWIRKRKEDGRFFWKEKLLSQREKDLLLVENFSKILTTVTYMAILSNANIIT